MKMAHTAKWMWFLALLFGILATSPASQGQISVGVAVHIGPPALPVYAQPICPGAGYMWTPGYWAYGPAGYFWVPGTWVVAPSVGLLWTPGYWGWGGGGYLWHGGYWGPHVGFYGGISYGFGYVGTGFVGGEWRGGAYHYNTAVTNVNTTIVHNTYNTTVVNNTTTVNRVSYNGGTGGVTTQPTAAERAAESEHHVTPTQEQTQHEHAASSNRALLASENHGTPAVAATARPGAFSGPGVVAARSSTTAATSGRPGSEGGKTAVPQVDRPPNARTTPAGGSSAVNTGGTANRPPNSQTNAVHTNTGGQGNTGHTTTSQPKNAHPNNNHPKQSHPHAEKPAEKSHPQ